MANSTDFKYSVKLVCNLNAFEGFNLLTEWKSDCKFYGVETTWK